MNFLKLIFIFILLTLSFTSKATTYKFVAGDNSIDTRMCILAAENDKASLKMQMSIENESNRRIASTLFCNDKIIANFAREFGAQETSFYLDRYTPNRYKTNRTNVIIRDTIAKKTIQTDVKSEDKTVIIMVSAL